MCLYHCTPQSGHFLLSCPILNHLSLHCISHSREGTTTMNGPKLVIRVEVIALGLSGGWWVRHGVWRGRESNSVQLKVLERRE